MRTYIDIISEANTEVVQDGAPEIGVKFDYQGKQFAVCGWMKEFNDPKVFGKRGGKLIACVYSEASWVLGLGGGGPGCVAPIASIRVMGTMGWSEEQRKKVVQSAMTLIHEKAMFPKPNIR